MAKKLPRVEKKFVVDCEGEEVTFMGCTGGTYSKSGSALLSSNLKIPTGLKLLH